MARVLCVMGESGSGKTTSMRNLPPEITLYIDCDGKGLSWKGWRNQYNVERKNYAKTSDKGKVASLLGKCNEMPQIKYIIVDTINGIMVDDEFARMGEKNYDKWQDLAAAVYGLIALALKMRDDLTVIFIAHSQTERDDFGNAFTRVKTSGRKLDKIVLESKFTTVLLAKRNATGQYVFETHANNSTAKTPLGAFDADEIPNDIIEVLKALEEY
jgi:hypothetical protein